MSFLIVSIVVVATTKVHIFKQITTVSKGVDLSKLLLLALQSYYKKVKCGKK